ncbi:Scarecrow-like protein 8 [Linum perenne]
MGKVDRHSYVDSATVAIHALLEAAYVIYEGNSEAASEILFRLTRFSNGKGDSKQRLMDYLFLALKSRVNPADNSRPVAELYRKEHAESTQLLFELSPCVKLGVVASKFGPVRSVAACISPVLVKTGKPNEVRSLYIILRWLASITCSYEPPDTSLSQSSNTSSEPIFLSADGYMRKVLSICRSAVKILEAGAKDPWRKERHHSRREKKAYGRCRG